MRKIRVGIIGMGRIGKHHLASYEKVEDAHIIAVADSNKDFLRGISETKNIPHIFLDYRDMLKLKEVDVVSICLPNFLHAPVTIDALKAGKHVLVEKPMALNASEAEEMVRAAKKARRKLMVGFNQRFREDVLVLKKFIAKGVLGDIYYARAGWLRRSGIMSGWFAAKSKSGGGSLIDLGVHMLDLTLWLMGNPRPISVNGSVYTKFGHKLNKKGRVFDVEDFAVAFIRLENEATIILETSWASHIEKEKVYSSLLGTKGGAEFGPLRIYTSSHGESVDITPSVPSWDIETTGNNALDAEIKHFVRSVREDKEPVSPGKQGLVIMKVLDAIYQSAQEKTEIKIR